MVPRRRLRFDHPDVAEYHRVAMVLQQEGAGQVLPAFGLARRRRGQDIAVVDQGPIVPHGQHGWRGPLAGRVETGRLEGAVERLPGEGRVRHVEPRLNHFVDPASPGEDAEPLVLAVLGRPAERVDDLQLPLLLDVDPAVGPLHAPRGGHERAAELEMELDALELPPGFGSTLQPAASRALSMSAKQCASVAQELFREGLITYMRTDSVHLSTDAIQSIRKFIKQSTTLGAKYLPSKPKYYSNKAKNAQAAHEAIRPTDVERVPKDLPNRLAKSAVQLYELIWKRTTASQIENGMDNQVSIDFSSSDSNIVLHASGSRIAFDGYRKIYTDAKNDDEENQERTHGNIPKVGKGEAAQPISDLPEQHFTKQPGRYNEASLIQKLEELGIGRPSTYPSIISVLQDRNYVNIDNRQ